MNNCNIQHNKTKKHTYKIVISILFTIIIVIALYLSNYEENIIINHTNNQPNITINDHVPKKNIANNDLQSLSTDKNWNLTLVNKWNPIPENYEVNLVKLPGGEKVDKRIYKPLMEMFEAAKEVNWDQLPVVVSGYRTQEKQQKLYNEKIAKYRQQGYSKDEAVKQAEQWVAAPGYSEHQLGLAVDINGATYDLYFWLQENSYKYGFIFRYPGNKSNITGKNEEVWHYLYVGVEAATEMYEQGLCLEEYLEKIEN